VCDEGYSISIGYKCNKCTGNSKATVITVLAIIIALVAALLWYVASELTGITEANDGISAVQSANTSIWQKLSKLPWSKLRIPLVVVQILTQYISITGLRLPKLYYDFLSWATTINIDFGWLVSIGCITQVTFYDKLLLNTLAPFGVVALLLCTYNIAQCRHRVQAVSAPVTSSSTRLGRTLSTDSTRTRNLDRVRAKHYSAFLLMTFLIYSTVSTVIFQAFACDAIEGTGTSYLRADYSVSCNTAKHTAYQAYAAVMILVYPVGIPLLYTWLLLRERRYFNQSHKRSSGPRLSNTVSTQQIQDTSAAAVQSIRFLWSAYTPKRYYWEVIECIRRLLLTGFVVFIFPNSSAQAAVACLLAAISLVIVVHYKPHADPIDTGIYVSGSIIIFLSMFLSLLVKVNISQDDTESQHVFAVLLILMNIGMILATIAQVTLVGRRTYASFINMSNNKIKHGNDLNSKANDSDYDSNEVAGPALRTTIETHDDITADSHDTSIPIA
jgi:hypothetical protein